MRNTEKLFVSWEIARRLKAQGFNEPCLGLYNPIKELCYPQLHYGEWKSFYDQPDQRWITLAPIYQQVIDWFRDTKNILITIKPKPTYLCIEINKIREFKSGVFQLEEVNSIGTLLTIYDMSEAMDKAINEAIHLLRILKK